MSSNLSRRTFLKGLGAGAASIAAMGVVGVPVMENASSRQRTFFISESSFLFDHRALTR